MLKSNKTLYKDIFDYLENIFNYTPLQGNSSKEGGRAFGKRYKETQEKNEKAQTQEAFVPQQAQEEINLGLRDRSYRIRRY